MKSFKYDLYILYINFLIRYRSGITTTMRILFGSRTFNIVKINNENDYNNFITLTAVENVGT